MRRMIFAAALLGLPAAQAGVLVPVVPVPGSVSTTVTGINNLNVITGSYKTADGRTHGFVGSLDGAYQTFDFGKADSFPRYIDDQGVITGIMHREGDFSGEALIRICPTAR